MVYLDNAATTPLNTAAISAMTHVMTETFGNPSSLHAYGRQASKELREAREEMAKQFQVPARKLIFTSGGTGIWLPLGWLWQMISATASQRMASLRMTRTSTGHMA